MNVLIIYDTVFGNTEMIARQIGFGMQSSAFVQIVKIASVTPEQIQNADFLVIGSPTRGFRATEEISAFVSALSSEDIEGKQVALFDTRLDLSDKKGISRFIIQKGGFAADKLAKEFKKLDVDLVKAPEGFLVIGEKGETMLPGEPERAAGWGKSLL